MEELPTPRATRVHVRGDFLRPGETVRPGVPAVFGTPAQDQPTNRLELARWLVDGRHPLTARVAVNRLWQACFGQGLVTTPADFGIQGDRPSHPELLDWLACELVSSGWNLRHVHRLIVTSATYRQSARNPNAAARRRDPMNRWLARAPRPRLPAEQLRDQALAVAGTLDDPGRIDRAFRLTLGRRPEPEERTRFLAFVTERRADSANAQAVWTSVATVLLNLDEFLCRP